MEQQLVVGPDVHAVLVPSSQAFWHMTEQSEVPALSHENFVLVGTNTELSGLESSGTTFPSDN